MSRTLLGGYLRLFSGTRRLVFISATLSVLQSLVLVPIAFLVRRIFNSSVPQHRQLEIVVVSVSILLLYLVSAALGLATRRLVNQATKKGLASLRIELSEKALSLSMRDLDDHPRATLHSVMVQDPERLERVANQVAAEFLPAGVVSVALMAVAFAMNPLLTLVLCAVLPLLYVLYRILGRRTTRLVRAWQEASTAYSGDVQTALASPSLIKVRAAEPIVLAKRKMMAEAVASAAQDAQMAQSIWGVTQFTIAAIAGVVVLALGGARVASGHASIGDLLGYYAVLALLLRQIGIGVGALPQIVAGGESLRRIEALLSTNDSSPYSGRRDLSFEGRIALHAVRFGHSGVEILSGLDLEIAPGERVAIIGPNGAGKSTVAALMLGLYRPWSGHLTADGAAYDDIDLDQMRSRIGVVMQDPLLMIGTVAENISFGRPQASRADVVQAARRSGALGFINQLKDGIDTAVGNDGDHLSGGQRQRIALARALLGEPALLVLDEPTNHLDDSAIASLLDALDSLPQSPGVLIITHDEALASWADRAMHLRDGRLTARVGIAAITSDLGFQNS